jgi:hypothetical protein
MIEPSVSGSEMGGALTGNISMDLSCPALVYRTNSLSCRRSVMLLVFTMGAQGPSRHGPGLA